VMLGILLNQGKLGIIISWPRGLGIVRCWPMDWREGGKKGLSGDDTQIILAVYLSFMDVFEYLMTDFVLFIIA